MTWTCAHEDCWTLGDLVYGLPLASVTREGRAWVAVRRHVRVNPDGSMAYLGYPVPVEIGRYVTVDAAMRAVERNVG